MDAICSVKTVTNKLFISAFSVEKFEKARRLLCQKAIDKLLRITV